MIRKFLLWFFTDAECPEAPKGGVCHNCGKAGLCLQEVPIHHWGPSITTWGLFEANGEKHRCPLAHQPSPPRKPKGIVCRCCGQDGFIWREVPSEHSERGYAWRLHKVSGEIHRCPVAPLPEHVDTKLADDDFLEELKKLR